jgi:hypothetical protein
MIVQNAVICNKCDDFIFSAHRHSYVECKCGNIAVDGGQDYLRRVGRGITDKSYIDVSWDIPDVVYQECADAVEHAIETNRNKFGIANAVLRALRMRDRVIAEGEQRIMAYNKDLDEVMVVEPDGTVNRYKKVV